VIDAILCFLVIILGIIAAILAIAFVGLSVYSMIGFEDEEK